MTAIISIIVTAIVIGLLVFIHELGHFLAARSVGVKVEKFAIGFGPRLFKWKPGETEYSLRLIMLGGYVQMLGDADPTSMTPDKSEEAQTNPRSYLSKSPIEKLWITVAGVLVNFVFAVFAFTLYLALVGGVVPLPKVIDYNFVGVEAEPNIIVVSDLFREEGSDVGIVLEFDGNDSFTDRAELVSYLESVENQEVMVKLLDQNNVYETSLVINGDGYASNLDLDFFPSEIDDTEEKSDTFAIGRLAVGEASEGSLLSEQLSTDELEILSNSYVLRVANSEIYNIEDLNRTLEENLGNEIEFIFVSSEGEEISKSIQLPFEKREDGAIIGATFGLYNSGFNQEGYLLEYDNAITGGFYHTVNVIGYNMRALGVFIGDAFAGQPDELVQNVGSIGTVGKEVDTIIGASFDIGPHVFVQILNLTAVISAILAVMNILPIPLLDGGNMVFIIIEGLTGKKLPESVMNIVYMIFFGLIVILSVVLIGLDIIKLFM